MALLYVGVNEIRPQKRSARLTDLETWVMKEMQRAQTFASQALLEVASFLRGLCFYGLIVFPPNASVRKQFFRRRLQRVGKSLFDTPRTPVPLADGCNATSRNL